MNPTEVATRRCALLSCDDLSEFECYDDLLVEPLAVLGWDTTTVSWRDEAADWTSFDLVVIRSTWDYQDSPAEFLATLRRIDELTQLENSLATVEWNLEKSYLRELADAGVPTVDTIWLDRFNDHDPETWFDQLACDEIVTKPTISANADDTFRLTRSALRHRRHELTELYGDRPIMVQPFLHELLTAGEFSVFVFDGSISHAIRKRPAPGDFRVQEEHGGQLEAVTIDADTIELARNALAVTPASLLYARVDLAPTGAGLAVMELELIEPSLYFPLAEGSARRFASALDRRFRAG